MAEHAHAAPAPASGDVLRKVAIVALLVGGMLGLHRFAAPSGDFDPTGMLALGFVVLASYTFGQIVAAVKLPEITGYMLAGVLLGPSVASMLPAAWAVDPLQHGILNVPVIGQLRLLDTLAISLIALTAGGELQLDALRRSLKSLVAFLGGMMAVGLPILVGVIYLAAGPLGVLSLPGFSGPTLVAFATVMAVVLMATSPAATIAVVTSTGAKGPRTQLIMATVIFMDVIMATLFSVAAALTASMLGGGGGDTSIGAQIAVHIGGSLALGALVGFCTILYLRYVGAELLLFLVGLVYTVAFVNATLHLDNILVFIAAGFTVSNLSKEGDTLIHAVEQLSLPTYVVFFTLAGAGLDLQLLWKMAPLAVTLVLVRMAVFWVGMNAGGRIFDVDPTVRTHGWTGLVSQAGVALGLAALIGTTYGEAGDTAKTLIISVISLNQFIGPVLLKVGLGLIGELPKAAGPQADAAEAAPGEAMERQPTEEHDPWGLAAGTGAVAADQSLNKLENALREQVALVREPLELLRSDADAWLRELRREFLRHDRQVWDRAAVDDLSETLRKEQAALARTWRALVLDRANRLRQPDLWRPEGMVTAIDELVEALPERIAAPWPDEAFLPAPGDRRTTRFKRASLRIRRAVRRTFRRELPLREIPLRNLGRYHLSGELPLQLERLSAHVVNIEAEVASNTRELFQCILDGYDAVAALEGSEPALIEERLRQVRQEVEERFASASRDLDAFVDEGLARATRLLGGTTQRLKHDARQIGTPDLNAGQRRFGRVYKARTQGIELLGPGLDEARKTTASRFSILALELELFALESSVKEAVERHGAELARQLHRAGPAMLDRIDTALEATIDRLVALLDSEQAGDAMVEAIRAEAKAIEPVVTEAARAAGRLANRLGDEQALGDLLDSLLRAAQDLTEQYVVPVRAPTFDEWHLPQAAPNVEIPFRSVATTYIEMSATRDLLELSRGLGDEVRKLGLALEELDRLIGFNVDLANAELGVYEDERVPPEMREIVRDMLVAPLRRTRTRLSMIRAEADLWPNRAERGVRSAVLDDIEALRRQVMDGRVSELKQRLRDASVGRWIVREAGHVTGRFAGARARLDRFLRTAVGEDRLELLRVRLGLHTLDEEVDPVAFRSPAPACELPIVYRRLFSDQAVEAGELVTGRAGDIARARRALQNGPSRALAVVGVQGVGKSSVVRAVAHDFEQGVTRISVDGAVDADTVAMWFEAAEPGRLHVVEGIQWLFTARPGGFEPLRRFVEGVVAQSGRTAWLVTAEASVWSCAAQLAPLEQAFPNVIRLQPLGPEELGAAVLARHSMTGFGIAFEAEEDLGWQLRFLLAREGDREQRYRDAWFRTLHAATGGLVHDALRLWTASIRSVDEDAGIVRVGPVPRPALAALERLPEDALLTLRLVARQGWMTADLHAELFDEHIGASRAHLSRLAHWGLLDEKDGTYVIAPHLEGPVHRTFVALGWAQ